MNKELIEIIDYHVENKMLLTVQRNEFDEHRGFPIRLTERFLCMTSIFDFYDDGYIILQNDDISDAYSKESDAFYEKICIDEGLRNKIETCPITDFKDIKTILSQLNNYKGYISVHCEKKDRKYNFYLGKIKSINENDVEFLSVGYDGEWNKETDYISFADITKLTVGDHYSKMFYKHAIT